MYACIDKPNIKFKTLEKKNPKMYVMNKEENSVPLIYFQVLFQDCCSYITICTYIATTPLHMYSQTDFIDHLNRQNLPK